jgi:hypothetical protein
MDLGILQVFPGTVAERIGLAPDDRILSYDGHKPTSVKQFVDAVADASGRRVRRLVIGRGTDVLQFDLPAGRVGVRVDIVRAAITNEPNDRSAPPEARSR